MSKKKESNVIDQNFSWRVFSVETLFAVPTEPEFVLVFALKPNISRTIRAI